MGPLRTEVFTPCNSWFYFRFLGSMSPGSVYKGSANPSSLYHYCANCDQKVADSVLFRTKVIDHDAHTVHVFGFTHNPVPTSTPETLVYMWGQDGSVQSNV